MKTKTLFILLATCFFAFLACKSGPVGGGYTHTKARNVKRAKKQALDFMNSQPHNFSQWPADTSSKDDATFTDWKNVNQNKTEVDESTNPEEILVFKRSVTSTVGLGKRKGVAKDVESTKLFFDVNPDTDTFTAAAFVKLSERLFPKYCKVDKIWETSTSTRQQLKNTSNQLLDLFAKTFDSFGDTWKEDKYTPKELINLLSSQPNESLTGNPNTDRKIKSKKCAYNTIIAITGETTINKKAAWW